MMNEKKIKIDPRLLTYIYESLHRYPDNLYDITKIKRLVCDGRIPAYDFYYENVPVIIEICDGAWEIIGEMKNLKGLTICNLELPDFSFLEKCSQLQKLILTDTNFSDCTPLQKLTNLKNLTLQHIERLQNTDVLSGLNCKIEDIAARLPIPWVVIGTEPGLDESWKNTNDIFAEYLNYIYILYDGQECIHTIHTADKGQPITKEMLEQLYLCIQQGRLVKLLAKKEAKEETTCTLTASFKEGWASIIIEELTTEEEEEYDEFEDEYESEFEPQSVFFYYHNLSCPNNYEESPACIEEGMPVPKAFSCDNFYEAAEIILYFLKTGKLYPLAEWYGYLDWI